MKNLFNVKNFSLIALSFSILTSCGMQEQNSAPKAITFAAKCNTVANDKELKELSDSFKAGKINETTFNMYNETASLRKLIEIEDCVVRTNLSLSAEQKQFGKKWAKIRFDIKIKEQDDLIATATKILNNPNETATMKEWAKGSIRNANDSKAKLKKEYDLLIKKFK